MIALTLVATSCSKDAPNASFTPNIPMVYSSHTVLSEAEIDQSLNATARAVALMAYKNAKFVAETRNLMHRQFDGDYNVIIPTLHRELSSTMGMDFMDEVHSIVPDEISGSFLKGFIYKDDDEKQTMYPQIYTPDEEYLDPDAPAAKVSPVVVPAMYFGDNRSADDVYMGYFYNQSGELDSVKVSEDDLSSRSVWVISINESELDDDGNPSVMGKKDDVFTPKTRDCGDPNIKKIVANKIQLTERKEAWVSGKIELYYSVMEYKRDGVVSDNQGVAAFKVMQPLIEKIGRKEMNDALDAQGFWEHSFTGIDGLLFDEWEIICKPKDCFIIFYEHDPFHVKSMVPPDAKVFDFEEDESPIPSIALRNFMTYIGSHDTDFDPNNREAQQELRYKTANNFSLARDINRDLPYGVLHLERNTPNGNYFKDWSANQNQGGRQEVAFFITPNPVNPNGGNNIDDYRLTGSGMAVEFNISNK